MISWPGVGERFHPPTRSFRGRSVTPIGRSTGYRIRFGLRTGLTETGDRIRCKIQRREHFHRQMKSPRFPFHFP